MGNERSYQSVLIEDRYRAGDRIQSIADDLGVSPQRVGQIANRAGLSRRGLARKATGRSPAAIVEALCEVARLDALSRERALTDAESRDLERAMRRSQP